MPRPDTVLRAVRPACSALKMLSRWPRLHGSTVTPAIRNMSGGVLSAEEPSLYPALHRVEEAGRMA